MKKKFLVSLILLSAGLGLYAQLPAAPEIKEKKIKKITKKSKYENSDVVSVTEWYYNANGDDTATYDDGIRRSYKIILYDAKQRIHSIKQYSAGGNETDETIYTYKPDGSFKTVNTDKQFGLKNTSEYDTKGSQKNRTIPDGSIYQFVYNTKGQLIKQYSIPKNRGIKFSKAYTYNAAGKLTASENTGDYPFSSRYEYDAGGLLKKVANTSVGDDNKKEVSIEYYEYKY